MESSLTIRDRSDLEKAMNRALRGNLALLQRSSEELSHAVADLVSACSSSRTVNALSPLLRAQTSAASLAAALEVLAKFVAAAAQTAFPESREESVGAVAVEPPSPRPEPILPPLSIPTPMAEYEPAEPLATSTPVLEGEPAVAHGGIELGEPITPEVLPPMAPEPEPDEPMVESALEAPVEIPAVPPVEFPTESAEVAAATAESGLFDLASLPPEERELHRRANRVAKVSMQDIQLMRPDEVRIGREQKDLCRRLRRDLDKARKEYERRFGSILSQPVDYFHHWMVEILAKGDPEALGEYPYPSPVLHH